MSYRHKWKNIKGDNLYLRWRTSDYNFLLSYLKKNKLIKPNHPLIEGNFDLRAVNLKKTRLAKLNLNKCDFSFGQFYSSGLTNSQFENCIFISSDFTSSNLTKSIFIDCSFVDCIFRRTNFTKAEFQSCDFTGSDLSKADLKESKFNQSIFDNVTLWQCSNIDSLSGNFRSADNLEIDISSFDLIKEQKLKNLIKKQGNIMKYEYDIAISFAGEDRKIVERIASALTKRDVRIFYDDYEKVDLWGKNLYDHLTDVYRHKAKYCLLVISKHYANKLWTNLERQSAQSRAFQENQDYILPLRLDNTEIKGILPTVGYIKYEDFKLSDLVTMIKQKLGYIPK